jgi:hypothetical protein
VRRLAARQRHHLRCGFRRDRRFAGSCRAIDPRPRSQQSAVATATPSAG